MLVGDRMSRPVVTIRPELPVPDALSLMQKEHVRRFPVVDARGKLVGIVSKMDLMNASASNVTTLSVWELNYLLSKITVEKVMARKVITVDEDCPIEEAARIMADHKLGGLPVLRKDEVVGIITETDLFKIFLELLGARSAGVRISMIVEDIPGKFNELTGSLRDIGVNIISIGTYLGETPKQAGVVIKTEGASLEAVRKALEPHAIKIKDIRQMSVG